ncbi:sugar phosphate isomerase/epimerase family protein [Microbacterium sp. 179-I 3D3 NHS]|uniref:sugar phosphate isomerase/epimerase family protein n=1 Tax=unclassified Microbacterium TaxID=2609290 RepID=UPI0039A2A8C0
MTKHPIVLMNDWVEPGPVAALIDTAQTAGYDGVEVWWPADAAGQRELARAVAATGAAVSLLASGGEGQLPAQRLQLSSHLSAIADSGLDPLHVTLHAGRDHWAGHQLDHLAEEIVAARSRTGLDVLVETHRARMLPSAHESARLLHRHPDLRITLDLSHWVVVAESLLHDQQAAVDLAVERADHVHARFGHAQSPQIDDPESARWAAALDRHLECWDRVVERLQDLGRRPTFLAEFGPVDYATPDPRTGRPLGDPTEMNRWMMRLLRDRYERSAAAA